MLEYGIKAITTNPTLITKANDIIRLVDSRNKSTRAFVIPAIYESEFNELFKKIAHKKWVEEKKKAIKNSKNPDLPSDDLMQEGWKNIEEYLDDER